VIDKDQEIAEQFVKQLHWQAPQCPGKIDQATAAPGQRRIEGASFRLADEVRYIQRRAAEHDGRVVTIGQLTLFSTQTGDAWIIDRDDHLAFRLACQGDPEPFHITETNTSFAIDWKGHYRIEGKAFIYTDRDTGRTTTVLGYPTDKLA